MSRLDRVLFLEEWLSCWVNPSVWILSRDVSDHCPLVVRYNSSDWGPKPFRSNNFWLQHKRFKDLVVRTWEGQAFTGGLVLSLKIDSNVLKGALQSGTLLCLGNRRLKRRN
ncbi:hypothetical protein QL285_020819 [Trifolium repens]|nr:hypothetical protein QL285_020819 [Trifolium repens]